MFSLIKKKLYTRIFTIISTCKLFVFIFITNYSNINFKILFQETMLLFNLTRPELLMDVLE